VPNQKPGKFHIQAIQERFPWIMKPVEVIDAALTPSRWKCALGFEKRGVRHAVRVDSTRLTRKFIKHSGNGESTNSGYGAGVSFLDRVDWRVRKFFWSTLWSSAVVTRLRPKKVRVPRSEKKIRLITAPESYSDFQSPLLSIPDDVSCTEASLAADILIQFLHFLQDVYPIVKPRQRLAALDPEQRLRDAYSFPYRLVRSAPRWHPELAQAARAGNLLGALAVGGPFAKLLICSGGQYFIDLRHIANYPVRDGLSLLGCRINFTEEGGRLRVSSVDYGDETASPGDGRWDYFERIALCALVTHLTVWRHGMQYHVAGVAPVAVITHNMPPDHPVRRLLAPHISETLSTNYYTHVTLRRSGFDVTGFSFPRDVIFKYYDDGAKALDISMLDVRREVARRGIPESLDYPYYKQALRYYELFEAYVGDYVNRYYADQAAISRDDDLRLWFEALDKHIVNGVRGYVPRLTKENLTRLCALYIYAVTVEHEENTLWDYAVFLPTTVHADGTGQTVGEVQSVLNFQFVISSATNRLMSDLTHLALDERAADIMRNLQTRLKELQSELESGPDHYWQVYPKSLEASVSA
jgi:lipoxygenase